MAHANEYRRSHNARRVGVHESHGSHRSKVGQDKGYRSPGSPSAIRFVDQQRVRSLQAKERRLAGGTDSRVRPERRENPADNGASGRLIAVDIETAALRDNRIVRTEVVDTFRELRALRESQRVSERRAGPSYGWEAYSNTNATQSYTITSADFGYASGTATWTHTITSAASATTATWASFITWPRSQLLDYEMENHWGMAANQVRNTPPPRQHVRLLAEGAAARAWTLLHSCLNEEQRDMLRVHHKFRVVSNLGNIFEIREGRMHNIYKLDMAGNPIENWCVLPQGELAPGDAMLAQKLWLETDEAETERCANITHIASGRLVRSAPVQYQPGIFVPELAVN